MRHWPKEFWGSLLSQLKHAKSFVRGYFLRFCYVLIDWANSDKSSTKEAYPDLSPVDNASNIEIYEHRLRDLLTKRQDTVRNIAISAPYGGGKSSFLRTYQRYHPYHRYTSISLATFQGFKASNDKADKTPDHDVLNDIERSIVQQLLYRSDSRATPNSRFRRIYPRPLRWIHTFGVSAVLVTWILLAYKSRNLEGLSALATNFTKYQGILLWLNAVEIGFLFAVTILLIRDAYKLIHHYRISSINPIKGEVTLAETSHDSVFNLYLEEIIYYFNVSKSDVVIFEDIDRFQRPELFIKLKELNTLINESQDVNQPVRFIYALRDDIFHGSERTKFFDAIIPIIPIVSRSNCFAYLRELLEDADLCSELSDEFLRDISLYLSDMRVLKSIVAEYGVYKAVLSRNLLGLDSTKLFSFIVYKNCYCDDFALLNDGKGMIPHSIRTAKSISHQEREELKSIIKECEGMLIESERELTTSLKELNSGMILHASNQINNQHGVALLNNKPLAAWMEPEQFGILYQATTFTYSMAHNQRAQALPKPFSDYLTDIKPSYEVRRQRIENKSEHQQKQIQRQIDERREKLAELESASLAEIAMSTPGDELFGIGDPTDTQSIELLSHMVENGYIDENYHLYISLFREGNISQNDLRFVFSVQRRKPLEVSYGLQDCKAVMGYLSKDKEHSQRAFFNESLVEYLLKSGNIFPLRRCIAKGLKTSSDCFELVGGAFERTEFKEKLYQALNSEWETFLSDYLFDDRTPIDNKYTFVMQLLALPTNEKGKERFGEQATELKKFLDENEAISRSFPVHPDQRNHVINQLIGLDIRFQTLSGVSDEDAAFTAELVNNQLFLLSLDNLTRALEILQKINPPQYLDYSSMARIDDPNFKLLLDKNIEWFAKEIRNGNILVTNYFDFHAILSAAEVEEIFLVQIVENIDFTLSDIALVETNSLWGALVENHRIEPNWSNVSHLIVCDIVAEETLVHLFGEIDFADALCKENEGINDEILERFRLWILADDFNDETFSYYVSNLDFSYSLAELEEASSPEIRQLLINGRMGFDEESIEFLKRKDLALASIMISQNYESFVSNEAMIDNMTADDLSAYLESEILGADQKMHLATYNPSHILSLHDPLKVLEIIIEAANVKNKNIPQLPKEIVIELLQKTEVKSIKVDFAVSQLRGRKHDEIASIVSHISPELSVIEEPDADITLELNPENIKLSKALKMEKFINDFEQKKWGLKDKLFHEGDGKIEWSLGS